MSRALARIASAASPLKIARNEALAVVAVASHLVDAALQTRAGILARAAAASGPKSASAMSSWSTRWAKLCAAEF
jgi:hypothetical protein